MDHLEAQLGVARINVLRMSLSFQMRVAMSPAIYNKEDSYTTFLPRKLLTRVYRLLVGTPDVGSRP